MIGEEDLILDEVLGEPEDLETLLAKIRQVGHRLTELTPEELAEQYGFTEEELDCVSLLPLRFRGKGWRQRRRNTGCLGVRIRNYNLERFWND